MIRITAYGLLVGWDALAFWFVLPLLGTLVANALWFGIWAFVEWRVPESKKVKAAREEDRQTILALKARLCDSLVERDDAMRGRKEATDVLQEMRSSNRNLNARATSALRDQAR
jgi:hypothetical protein